MRRKWSPYELIFLTKKSGYGNNHSLSKGQPLFCFFTTTIRYLQQPDCYRTNQNQSEAGRQNQWPQVPKATRQARQASFSKLILETKIENENSSQMDEIVQIERNFFSRRISRRSAELMRELRDLSFLLFAKISRLFNLFWMKTQALNLEAVHENVAGLKPVV